MVIPSVMFLEMAKDMLKSRDSEIIEAETKQFHSLGPKRKEEIVASVLDNDPMLAGYLLGIETARVLLMMNPQAVSANVAI